MPQPSDPPPAPRVILTEPRANWRQGLLIGLLAIVLVGTAGWAIIRYIGPHVHARRQLVETFLYKHAHEPAKLEIQSVMYGPRWLDNGVMTQYVLVRFREKSAVGANPYQDMILRIEEDQMVFHDDVGGKLLAASHTFDWSPDPNGPGSSRSP